MSAVVEVLVKAGCPVGPDALNSAAIIGDLPVLRYLHEDSGVGFGPGTLAAAAEGGCEAMVEWLFGAGCRPGDRWTEMPYLTAGQSADLGTLQCLRRLGVPWSADVVKVATILELCLPPVRWLVEQGAVWSWGQVAAVVGWGKRKGLFLDSAAWLEARAASEHGGEGKEAER